jgi:hypothetical protein
MTPVWRARAYEIGTAALLGWEGQHSDVMLNAPRASAMVVNALDRSGLAVVEVCACGQPVGFCHDCGEARCWHCDPGLGKSHAPMSCNRRHAPTSGNGERAHGSDAALESDEPVISGGMAGGERVPGNFYTAPRGHTVEEIDGIRIDSCPVNNPFPGEERRS